MRIVVTGGSGDLGGRVVRELTARGQDAVAASRRTGVDLATGDGLDAVLAGADAVVHCASSQTKPQDVDVAGARRIGESLRRLNSSVHVVSISIVGCDLVSYPYYRAKVDAERALAESGVPATVLRATQFHSLAAFFGTAARVGPLTFSIGTMRIQPVDIDWVAGRLTDYATGPAPSGYRRRPTLPARRHTRRSRWRSDSRRTMDAPPRGWCASHRSCPSCAVLTRAESCPGLRQRSAGRLSRTGSRINPRRCRAGSAPPPERTSGCRAGPSTAARLRLRV
ncbi:MAG: SDR family oxidoreductase [Knoellia sp.]